MRYGQPRTEEVSSGPSGQSKLAYFNTTSELKEGEDDDSGDRG